MNTKVARDKDKRPSCLENQRWPEKRPWKGYFTKLNVYWLVQKGSDSKREQISDLSLIIFRKCTHILKDQSIPWKFPANDSNSAGVREYRVDWAVIDTIR